VQVSDVWVSSRVSDAYYHFIVTRYSATDVRVAFELASREAGHITSRIDHVPGMAQDVDSRAEWYLDPQAMTAYRTQRLAGWIGETIQ
jgi:hypothetical protein